MPVHQLTADNTYRGCAHCRKALTDPASRECGVGPICRRKANDLYAKDIRANLALASALIMDVDLNSLPEEVREVFGGARDAFLQKLSRLQRQNDDMTNFLISGGDFRFLVEAIDYVLSFSVATALRNKLGSIVEQLGYVELSGILRGISSRGHSKVWFEDGFLYLQGTGCTDGWRAMKANIPGIVTPRRRGDRRPYKAHASHAKQFLSNVQLFWPFYDADLAELQKQADQWVEQHPSETAETPEATAVSEDTACIKLRNADFVVSFPWLRDRNMYTLITELKTVDYRKRQYNPNDRTWSFTIDTLDQVRQSLNIFFGKEKVTELQTSELTPANLYRVNRQNSGARPRRAGSRRRSYGNRYY